MQNANKEIKTIKRFSKAVRIAHWTNATAVIMLFITALPLYAKSFHWINAAIGAQVAMTLHKVFAVIFILPTIFVLIVDPKSFIDWTKQLFSWKSYDAKFLKEFPKEFFGRKADIPKQGFFNAGQKINSILTILAAIIMVCSGFVMWFPSFFAKSIALWAYPFHNLGAGLMIAVVIGHIYLSVGHPDSRPSFRGMTKGDVDVSYAKAHHGRWYDEVMAGETKTK